MPHSWAHMFGAGLSSWADTSPIAELVALQWFCPFNFGKNGVAIPGDDEFREVMFVRQDSKGFLSLCMVWAQMSLELPS